MKIIDISPLIDEHIAVFPGDVAFTRETTLAFKNGDNLDLSSIRSTLHLGAHADAPSHYHTEGESIEKSDLALYYGQCQVIEVKTRQHTRVTVADLLDQEIQAPRVLFKTRSFPEPNQWRNDFMGLSPALIDYLATQKVKLVGIDTPSVDLAEDKDLLCHQALYNHGIRILEGLKLTHIMPGLYTLVAFPLHLKGAEASPVRAVLISSKDAALPP